MYLPLGSDSDFEPSCFNLLSLFFLHSFFFLFFLHLTVNFIMDHPTLKALQTKRRKKRVLANLRVGTHTCETGGASTEEGGLRREDWGGRTKEGGLRREGGHAALCSTDLLRAPEHLHRPQPQDSHCTSHRGIRRSRNSHKTTGQKEAGQRRRREPSDKYGEEDLDQVVCFFFSFFLIEWTKLPGHTDLHVSLLEPIW